MKLKSPTDEPICVSLTNGTGIRIPPEGRDVPSEFFKAAVLNGAVPMEDDGKALEQNVIKPDHEATIAAIVEGVKTMLVDNPNDFVSTGLPNRKVLGKVVGFSVDAADLETAWSKVQAEAAEIKLA
ncbi:hypothetical protein [Propionivibrio sp.]|uniref:hypothetical protein n=1 Tax=Propionivibrio sp. TaxID=2212460 RepID=UPI003BF42A36